MSNALIGVKLAVIIKCRILRWLQISENHQKNSLRANQLV